VKHLSKNTDLRSLFSDFEVEQQQQLHLQGGRYSAKSGDPTTYTTPGWGTTPPDCQDDCECDDVIVVNPSQLVVSYPDGTTPSEDKQIFLQNFDASLYG